METPKTVLWSPHEYTYMCTCAYARTHTHTVYGLIYDVVRHNKFYPKRKDTDESSQPALPGQKPDLENMKEESVA